MTLTLGRAPAARRRPRRNVTWESRTAARRPAARKRTVRVGAGPRLFVLSAGMLASAFLVALLYLRFATSIAAGGYDLQSLEDRRDELRRANQLLELEVQRLDAPARIEAEARRIGLVKATRTLFLTAGPSVTLR